MNGFPTHKLRISHHKLSAAWLGSKILQPHSHYLEIVQIPRLHWTLYIADSMGYISLEIVC